MASHKFHIGESVNLMPAISRNVPGGTYQVTKQLPHNGRVNLNITSKAHRKSISALRGKVN
jgi:hypothetical protein